MSELKQKSPHWEAYSVGNFSSDDFPFNEGFPQGGPFGNGDKIYELILHNGKRTDARVDYSTQYRAEGLQWRTVDYGTLDRSVVVAWQEK